MRSISDIQTQPSPTVATEVPSRVAQSSSVPQTVRLNLAAETQEIEAAPAAAFQTGEPAGFLTGELPEGLLSVDLPADAVGQEQLEIALAAELQKERELLPAALVICEAFRLAGTTTDPDEPVDKPAPSTPSTSASENEMICDVTVIREHFSKEKPAAIANAPAKPKPAGQKAIKAKAAPAAPALDRAQMGKAMMELQKLIDEVAAVPQGKPVPAELQAKLDQKMAQLPPDVQQMMMPPGFREMMGKAMEEFKNMIDTAVAVRDGKPLDDRMAQQFAAMGLTPGGPAGMGALGGMAGMAGMGGTSPSQLALPPTQAIQFPTEAARRLLAEDWKEVRAKSKATAGDKSKKDDKDHGKDARQNRSSVGFVSSMFSKLGGKKADVKEGMEGAQGSSSSSSSSSAAAGALHSNQFQLPEGFEDTARMNATMTGANMSWIRLVLANFDQLVGAVANADEAALEGACDVISLQFHRGASGKIVLKEFQAVLLASFRMLLPLVWDSQREAAWTQMWTITSEKLQQCMPLPLKYEKPVAAFLSSLSVEEKKQFGTKVFDRLFTETPKAQNYFKLSNARLGYLVAKGLDLCGNLFKEPSKTVEEVTALGLRHIMFHADPKYFQPFVSACTAEVQKRSKDEDVIQGVNWALCVIATIMLRTLEEGATPLVKAMVKNDVKGVKRELAKAPKSERASWALGRD